MTGLVLSLPRPKRIQRRRTKGWRMPPSAIYVGRPTIYGNPFRTALDFRLWLDAEDWESIKFRGRLDKLRDALDKLRGHDLACWCSLNQLCHADVLLEIANKEVLMTEAAMRNLGDLEMDEEKDEGDGGLGSGKWLGAEGL